MFIVGALFHYNCVPKTPTPGYVVFDAGLELDAGEPRCSTHEPEHLKVSLAGASASHGRSSLPTQNARNLVPV